MLPRFGAPPLDTKRKGREAEPSELVILSDETTGQGEGKPVDSVSADHAPNNKPVYVLNGPITVKEMSERLELKPFKILSDLISMKVFVQNAEKTIHETYQEKIATKRGYQVRRPTEEEKLQQKIVELRDQFGAK